MMPAIRPTLSRVFAPLERDVCKSVKANPLLAQTLVGLGRPPCHRNHTLSNLSSSLPLSRITHEAARLVVQGHPSAFDSHLLDALGNRCQGQPNARMLWRDFQADPWTHRIPLESWLQSEIDAFPGFAQEIRNHWHDFTVWNGQAAAEAAPRTRSSNSTPSSHVSAQSLWDQALPGPILSLWQLCAPERMTQSLLDSVHRLHGSASLMERGRHLARHMVQYLRLTAQTKPTDPGPFYYDGMLLQLLEEHLQLPSTAPATRSASFMTTPVLDETSEADSPSSSLVSRILEMECPDRVWIGDPMVKVKVRLSPTSQEGVVPHMTLSLQKELPVLAWITSPGFDNLGSHVQTLWAGPELGPAEAEFELQPQTTGRTYITIHCLQEGTPLGTLSMQVEVSDRIPEQARQYTMEAQSLTLDVSAESPDLTLFVNYDTSQTQPRLLLNLYCDSRLAQSCPPLTLRGDPQTYYDSLYRRLSDLTDLFDLKKSDAAAMENMRQAVRKLGHSLWNDLIPQALQERYALERAEWRTKSFLVITDEPFIPWELTWPYGYQGETWEDETPWCLSMRMTRWLHRDQEGSGLPGPPAHLDLERFAFVGPSQANLSAVSREGSDLKALMQQAGVCDTSPPANTLAQVTALLESGDYDWFHLASHGEFAAANSDLDSALRLDGNQPFTPSSLIGPEVQGHLFQRRPGFVLNACHTGRQGLALTQLGGWANRLVGSGAGLFMGPLWTVTDESARRFARHFYALLLEGDTVAQALHGAREVIRQTGDPTWLAYSVYAHPNARLRIGPRQPQPVPDIA